MGVQQRSGECVVVLCKRRLLSKYAGLSILYMDPAGPSKLGDSIECGKSSDVDFRPEFGGGMADAHGWPSLQRVLVFGRYRVSAVKKIY